MKIINDSHDCGIGCTRWQCESIVLKDYAIDAGNNATLDASKARGTAEERLIAYQQERDKLIEKYRKPQVSKARMKTTKRDSQDRILLPARGRPRSKRSDSQRKDGKRVVFVHGVLGVGGINNKNIGFVKVLTKDYTGY